MTECENGWYLRSDGYMTSECSYQRIGAMKGNRALDNHGKLVFVKFMGGNETDSRVYIPHPGTCEVVHMLAARNKYERGRETVELSCGHYATRHDAYCPKCGRWVKR